MPDHSSSVSLRAAVSNMSQITEEIPDNITSWASAQHAQKKATLHLPRKGGSKQVYDNIWHIQKNKKNKSSASQLNKQTKKHYWQFERIQPKETL